MGKKGSKKEHLNNLDFKLEKRKEEAQELDKALERIREQKINIDKIENIKVTPLILKNKIAIDRSDWELVMEAAQKHMLEEKEDLRKKLKKEQEENERLALEYTILSNNYNKVTDRIANSFDYKIEYYKMENEYKKLYKIMNFVEEFLKINNLTKRFKAFKRERDIEMGRDR